MTVTNELLQNNEAYAAASVGQTRSVSLVCPTLAAVSLRWQKSVDRGAEAIYVSGYVMADSLYV